MNSIKFADLNPRLISQIRAQLGAEQNSPNWDCIDDMEIGFAKGAKFINLCLWQGNRYWLLDLSESQTD